MPRNKRHYLLVDGYNIINSWEELKTAQESSLDEARELLIDMMSELKSITDEEIIVVFDSYLQKRATNTIEHRKGIEIVFTKENETADNYIEKLVANKSKNDQYKVASSDSIIQSMIFSKGATRISARELFYYYKSNKDHVISRSIRNKGNSNKNIVSLDDKSIAIIDAFKEEIDKD